MAPLRALILDYGNVLTLPQASDVIAAMAGRLGADVAAFSGAYWAHRRGYDAGDYAAPEYWRRVLRSLGRAADGSGEHALFDWLTDRDGDSWMRYRDEVWELAERARAEGVRTGMLTNMSRELAARIRRGRPLERWFDAVVVSAEARIVKPDPRIYRLCLEALGADPGQTLFVDDRPENVEGAARLGMRVARFDGADAAAALRTALGQSR